MAVSDYNLHAHLFQQESCWCKFKFSINPEGLTLKRFCLVFIFAFAIICSAAYLSNSRTITATNPQEGHGNKHGLSVKQYEDFHHVLHPLEHDALPKKDFRRIRTQSSVLVKRGRALVKLGVPKGTSVEHKQDFAKGLAKFNQALAKFRADARKGTDEQLKTSYTAVHDSFEMLAAMLPRG
jgi:hypothetical protein